MSATLSATGDIVQTAGPLWAYITIAALTLIESLPFVGLLFPGTIALILSGAIIWVFSGNVALAFLAGITGAIVSDILGFELGKRRPGAFGKRRMLKEQLVRVEAFRKKRPAWNMIIGKFLGNKRSLIPFVYGRKSGRFTYYSRAFFGSALRVTLFLGSGYVAMLALRTSFLWIARKESFLLAMALSLLLLFVLWKWSIARGRRALSILATLIWKGASDVMRQPFARSWIARHGWVGRAVRQSLSVRTFFGIRFTAICLVILYAVFQLWQITLGYLNGGPLVTFDTNVSNLLLAFRTPQLVNLFYAVTLLGSEWMIIGLASIMTAAFWMRRRQIFIFALWINLAFTTITVWYLKLLFGRARPDVMHATYRELTYSFPSAHAAYGVALYGFVAYLALRSVRLSWRRKMTVLFACLTCVLLIDFSRLYLGVHYVSDVLAGSLLGLIMLLCAISIGEWLIWHYHRANQTVSPRTFTVITATSILLAVTLILTNNFPSPSILSQETRYRTVSNENVLSIFDAGGLPRSTETLTGGQQEPLSLLIIATSDGCLEKRFSDAGWVGSDTVSPLSLYYAFRAAVLNDPYATAPMTPAFYDGEPHNIGLQKAAGRSVRTRHHARIWRTQFVTPLGRIYVGTASLDTNIKWGGWKLGITHAIDPQIDRERDLIALELLQSGAVKRADIVPFVGPLVGRNFTGDPFVTNGNIAILTLASCSENRVQANSMRASNASLPPLSLPSPLPIASGQQPYSSAPHP